jgi:biotin operon repressor
MTETNKRERRKSKGKLSVLDEFSDGAGDIMFSPALAPEQLSEIEARTRLADVPKLEQQQSRSGVKVEPNWRQARDKLETNQRQTEDMVSGLSVKTRDKLETNQRQDWIQKGQTGDKLESQVETLSETNWRQTEDKVETKADFSSLVGLQRELVIFFYESCQFNRSSDTEKLSVEHIAKSCETSASSIKKTIQRLEERGFLKRKDFKNGRGGWTIYSLPKDVFQDLLRAQTGDKLRTNWRQTRDKVRTELETQPRTAPSSSSREVLFKESSTTPTTVADELSTLDLTQLREFGVTVETFKRAVQLHPTVTIEALSDLSFRLGELFKNPKERAKIQNARGFVIRLVEQLAQGITPLDHIETLNDRLMREYAHLAKQRKLEQQGFEDTLLQEAFEKWDRETIEEDKFRQVPLAQNAPAGSPRAAVLREHFRESVWPNKREAILKGEA